MEECGRGAAVEQLTARGMVSIPAMGAIAVKIGGVTNEYISIPAMGGNRGRGYSYSHPQRYQSPQWGQ